MFCIIEVEGLQGHGEFLTKKLKSGYIASFDERKGALSLSSSCGEIEFDNF